nr:excalibur calcium-binding domain-containing protein [Rhodococcus sp. (in: high G+C Gram-positive bacteria)]
MTDPFDSKPYVFPGAQRPEHRRPLLAKVAGWFALVVGLLILLASLVDFSLAGIVLGVCAAAAGGLYLFGPPSRGRIVWATPAIAVLPALVAFALSSPTPEPVDTAQASHFAAPAIAEVSTTTPRPTTTTPVPSTSAPALTTVAPETVTVYAPAPSTTTPYVPAPAPAPVYVAEPEPVYVAEPEPVYAPAPLAAVPDTAPSVSYANCTAVKDAGAAPIYRGEPGYSSKLDRDGDGVACEK